MKKYFDGLASMFFDKKFNKLSSREKLVIESIADQTSITTNVNSEYKDNLSLGDKVADGIAKFGGSWKFIFLFFYHYMDKH